MLSHGRLGGLAWWALLLTMMGMSPGLAAPPGVEAANGIGCGSTLGPGGTFTLTSNVGPCSGIALRLVGPATLDLNGFDVSCSGAGTTGIRVTGSSAVVRNGSVGLQGGCVFGVEMAGSQGMIQHVEVAGGGTGIFVSGASNLVVGNHVHGFASQGGGVTLFSQGNVVTGNRAENGLGFSFGFGAFGCSSVLSDNEALNNFAGFFVQSPFCPGANGLNTLRANTASGNGLAGFALQGTHANLLIQNDARSNGHGIRLTSGQSRNTIMQNNATGNGLDLEDWAPCGSNLWIGNIFDTAVPGCLR